MLLLGRKHGWFLFFFLGGYECVCFGCCFLVLDVSFLELCLGYKAGFWSCFRGVNLAVAHCFGCISEPSRILGTFGILWGL